MLFVQITDTHIAANKGAKTSVMAENLAKCIEHINQIIPLPDLVLVTGDISYHGNQESLQQAKELLEQLKMPFFVTPGNHDNYDDLSSFLSVFKDIPPLSNADKSARFINYSLNQFAIRFIGLDSTQSQSSGGGLCQSSLDWLDRELAKDMNKPTVLFMHHPPLKLGIIETDTVSFHGADKLASIIKKYKSIERILCGHVHLQTVTAWNGTVVNTAPSIGMELNLDLTMTLDSSFLLENPSFQLYRWTEEEQLSSYLITANPNKESSLF